MAKQFPRADKPKAGGTKVILRNLINCYALPADNAVLKDPILALKTTHFGFYTSSFCKIRALIAGQNRFSERKNLSNTSETRLLSKWQNTRKTGPLVTTNHLFLPSQRRRAVSSLPIAQPISDLSRVSAMRKPGGGGGLRRNAEFAS